MMLLFGIGLLLFFSKAFHGNFSNYRHPITAILLLHFVWILISSINSQFPIISAKVTLAKLWYIIPFYFLAYMFWKEIKTLPAWLSYAVYMLAISIMIVLFRHSQKDFSFEDANFVVTPLFRNHVNYACIIVIFCPICGRWWCGPGRGLQKWYTWSWWLYMRWASIFLYPCCHSFYGAGCCNLLHHQKRWMMHALLLASLTLMMGIAYLMYNNNYLRFNPQYEKPSVTSALINYWQQPTKWKIFLPWKDSIDG